MFITAAVVAAPAGKILYLYDEVNEQSTPYIGYFREALAAEGIAYEESAVAEVSADKLKTYGYILAHGMVMAFNMKSPLRDWLKTSPDLRGKKVSLFVTANRWFLDDLFGQLRKLLERDQAELVDAVSMATKELDAAAEREAVRAHVARLK